MTTVTEVRERPILFSGERVRAILEGRKTQTRRVVKPTVRCDYRCFDGPADYWPTVIDSRGEARPADHTKYGIYCPDGEWAIPCPYGRPGDRLWVRETWQLLIPQTDFDGGYVDGYVPWRAGIPEKHPGENWCVWYGADSDDADLHPSDRFVRPWRPSIHMPRWASRITLEITGVRVERVQEITEEDARAEGAPDEKIIEIHLGIRPRSIRGVAPCSHREGFQYLWDSINAKRGYGWDANPWVWVVEFKRVED